MNKIEKWLFWYYLICNKIYLLKKRGKNIMVGHSEMVQSQLALFYEQNTWVVSHVFKVGKFKKAKILKAIIVLKTI